MPKLTKPTWKQELENISVEHLVSSFGVYSAQEAMYTGKKNPYSKKRLRYEYELIRRLGGSWEVYCAENGWTVEETEAWMK